MTPGTPNTPSPSPPSVGCSDVGGQGDAPPSWVTQLFAIRDLNGKALSEAGRREFFSWMVITLVGAGAYGVSIGWWRAPLQGLYAGIKMPLVMLLTLIFNGLLNAMVAALLGSGLSFRETTAALLRCVASCAVVLGAMAPVGVLFSLSIPGPYEPGSFAAHDWLLVAQTAIIAAAGIVTHIRLWRWLAAKTGAAMASRVLLAWLAGNLLVGAQWSYSLRPLFGHPSYQIEFLRPEPLKGNFYEVIWRIVTQT